MRIALVHRRLAVGMGLAGLLAFADPVLPDATADHELGPETG